MGPNREEHCDISKLNLAACWGVKPKIKLGICNPFQWWKGWSRKSLGDTKEMSLTFPDFPKPATPPHSYPDQAVHDFPAGVKWTARCLSPVPPCPRSRHSPLRHSDVTQSCCDFALKSCLQHQLRKSELPHLRKPEPAFWGHYNQPKVRIQHWPPTSSPQTSPPKPSNGKRHFPKPKSPFNLYFLTWKINFAIVRCSASKRNYWILGKCEILGMPCAFPICQHMEWGIMALFIIWIPVLHKTFLLLCLGTDTTSFPSKRSPNLMEKEKN